MKSSQVFSIRPSFRQKSDSLRRAMIVVVFLMLSLAAALNAAAHGTNLSLSLRPEQAKADDRRAAFRPEITAQCQYVITPGTQSFAARGGAGSLSVLAAGSCSWAAASTAPWINITSTNSGSGLGRVNYSVLANTTVNQRTGIITVAGMLFTVTQAGAGANTCAVTSISAGQTVNGSLAPGDCQSPLRVRDGARPFADRYSFNATGGQPVVVSLTSADFDTYLYLLDAGGTVIAQNDDATSNRNSRIPAGNGFLTLPASGTFTIEVTSFSGSGAGSYALSLTMPAGNCTYAISPASQPFPAAGGAGAVNVTTQAGCTWVAASNSSWITTASGGGAGAGAVNYAVASNAGLARTGTISIAGLSFTVTQSGTNGTACPLMASVSPPGGAAGGGVTISGTNFTGVTAVKFTAGIAAQFNVLGDTQINAVIPAGAASGPLTISKPTCPDVMTSGFTVNRAVATVSAASFLGASLAGESIVAAFGQDLATGVQTAAGLPLPTTLLGTTVKVKDSAARERIAPLFFVAPTQVNYQIPEGTAAGTATVTVTSGNNVVSLGTVNIANVAPGLFAANASGQGLAAAVALRLRADGSQSYEQIAQFDPSQNKIVALPIDLGPATDQVFLLLFGTGWRNRTDLSAVSLKIGGADSPVLYAGPQGDFIGLDQINAGLPRSLMGRGEVDLVLTVDGKMANTVKVNVK